MKERYAGVLLPVTALPSPYGVGGLGSEAFAFVDFLVKAGQSIWQVLPLVPTGYGDSPYASACATAGNPYLIDIDLLIKQDLITRKEAEEYSCEVKKEGDGLGPVDYEALFYRRIPLLKLAFSRFDRKDAGFQDFIAGGEYNDFALFMALKEAHDWKPLSARKQKYRKRDENALTQFLAEKENEVMFWLFTQYEFFRQWQRLKAYANSRGIQIMGDMPLYVSEDSTEVWARPELFQLDREGRPIEVAGVPPDYFSEDGQLWGNPLYNWEEMKKDGYAWWTGRLKKALSMYDLVRIDHFRGFDRYYAIPFGCTNARTGRWRDGPKEALFEGKRDWKIIAEDLGILDEGVYRLMHNTGYPRMKVLEFAFDGDPRQEYKPSNCDENCVIYTGTHDNAPFIEFLQTMDTAQRKDFYTDLESECKRWGVEFSCPPHKPDAEETMHLAREAAIQTAYRSRAKYVILPIQDLLGYGAESRINTPGTISTGNWSWRCPKEALSPELARKMCQDAKSTGR